MDELIKNINWKNTKGIVLIAVVGLIVIGLLFVLLPEQDRYLAYITFIVMIIFVINKLTPKQVIKIGPNSEVDGGVEQESSDTKVGKQEIIIDNGVKIKEGVKQK